MEKRARVNVYMEDAIRIVSDLKNFAGSVRDWKIAIYDLFRWDMTYGYAYQIHVRENRDGVFVDLRVKPDFKNAILETMEDLGFRKTKTYDDPIGAVDCTDLPEDMLLDFIVVQY